MNFKKILSITSLLTVGLFSSLSVVACNISQTKNIINTIDEINDLEIFISSEDETKPIFEVLSNFDFGLVEKIFRYENKNKIFEKEFFKLDFENIYFDKNKIKQVSEEDKIVANATYYFQYIYKNIRNAVLVPVKILKTEEIINDDNNVIENTGTGWIEFHIIDIISDFFKLQKYVSFNFYFDIKCGPIEIKYENLDENKKEIIIRLCYMYKDFFENIKSWFYIYF